MMATLVKTRAAENPKLAAARAAHAILMIDVSAMVARDGGVDQIGRQHVTLAGDLKNLIGALEASAPAASGGEDAPATPRARRGEGIDPMFKDTEFPKPLIMEREAGGPEAPPSLDIGLMRFLALALGGDARGAAETRAGLQWLVAAELDAMLDRAVEVARERALVIAAFGPREPAGERGKS